LTGAKVSEVKTVQSAVKLRVNTTLSIDIEADVCRVAIGVQRLPRGCPLRPTGHACVQANKRYETSIPETTIHAYPTLSESIHEAAGQTFHEAMHI